jgi:hypothetical protein
VPPRLEHRRIFPAEKLLALWPNTTHAETIASALGVTRASINRWRAGGVCFNDIQADAFACRIGLHPANIWDNWA